MRCPLAGWCGREIVGVAGVVWNAGASIGVLWEDAAVGPIGDVNLSAGQSASAVDLPSHFVNPDYTGTLVEFDSNAGSFVVQLTDSATPRTVANFLRYVDGGVYDNTIVHRSQPGFVVQGG